MTPNEYQTLAARTLIEKPDFEISKNDLSRVYWAVQLAETTGHVADYLKKGIFHRHGITEKALANSIQRIDHPLGNFWITKDFPRFKLSFMLMLFWNVLGLIGEAGEIANLALQWLVNGEYKEEEFIKELGDCLWYLSAICTKLNVPLEEVMQANIAKLKARYPDGYSSEASLKRISE